MDALELHNEFTHSNYLGMLIYVGQSKTCAFNFIAESMWKRVQGWNGKPMSRDGKETLLKFIAQAIPTYIMSCFELPEVRELLYPITGGDLKVRGRKCIENLGTV
jgi:hypothetical protein